MTQYRWRKNAFEANIIEIENKMKNLKNSGMRWQDNTDQFVEEFDRLKSSIINTLEETRKLYPDIEISCKVIPTSESRLSLQRHRYGHANRASFPMMFSSMESAVDFILCFYVKLDTPIMTTHVMDDSEHISEYRHVMSDTILISGTYMLPMISRHWGRDVSRVDNAPTSQYSWFLEAIYLDPMRINFHPYISAVHDKYSYSLGEQTFSGNICTGNMESDLRNSLLNKEIMAHITYLITWATNYYVPQTNPLHRIDQSRRRGHDMTMIEWSNDLNTTSSGVFLQSSLDSWQDCTLSKDIYGAMLIHAHNDQHTNRYHHSNTFNQHNAEYPIRLDEWINQVCITDLSCNNCEFHSECDQYSMLKTIFSDEKTPEEEGIIGMLFEIYDLFTNIINRDSEYTELFYIEMCVSEAWRYHIFREYDKLMMVYHCIQRWYYVNNEPFTTTGIRSNRYQMRIKTLWRLYGPDIQYLYENHLHDDSKFVWTLDNVKKFTRPKEKAITSPVDDVITEWLHQNDPDELPPNMGRPAPLVDDTDMTPEQRSIQWAIQHGGANNL